QAEDGIRDATVTGVQTCALPICVTKPYLLSQHNFLSVQPSAIGADSIDLAVVRYETKRLSQRPTGLRVGGIALMKDRERAYEFGIDQIRIEGRQLLGRKQSFINNSTRSEEHTSELQ